MSFPAINLNMQTVKTNAVRVYVGVVVLSMTMGAIKGAYKWAQWYSQRKHRKIKFKTLEPVVNVASDVGQLAFDVTVASVFSGIVGATAPISVPLIRQYFDETDEPKSNGTIVATVKLD